jgi:chromosome segregation ATPase
VSVEGELFEPAGGSMALDFGSKISDLTKAILLGDSVESLRDMLAKLAKTVEKKNAQLHEMTERISEAESDKVRLEIQISNNETRAAEESALAAGKEKALSQMLLSGQALSAEEQVLVQELGRHRRRLELIAPTIERLSARLAGIDESSAKAQLAEINVERNLVVRQVDSINMEASQLKGSLGSIESRLEFDQRQLAQMDEEKERLTLELGQRKKQVEEMQTKSQSLEIELKSLRDQEQQIIDSSGNAYSVLREYEQKIKGL